MEEVEVSVQGEGALTVVQCCKLRITWMPPEDFERHRVLKWPNCDGLSKRVPDAKFNTFLKVFFVVALSLALLNLIILELLLTHNRRPNEASTWNYIFNQTWLFGHFHISREGLVPLAVLAAVVLVGTFVKKAAKDAGSAPPRGEEVQTVAVLVQQV